MGTLDGLGCGGPRGGTGRGGLGGIVLPGSELLLQLLLLARRSFCRSRRRHLTLPNLPAQPLDLQGVAGDQIGLLLEPFLEGVQPRLVLVRGFGMQRLRLLVRLLVGALAVAPTTDARPPTLGLRAWRGQLSLAAPAGAPPGAAAPPLSSMQYPVPPPHGRAAAAHR